MGETLKLGFTGDVMLGRLVNDTVSLYGYRYPWGNVLPILQKSDLNVINLETTLTKRSQAVPKIFNFKADPDKVQCLIEANIDVVTLANNHLLDFGEEGLQNGKRGSKKKRERYGSYSKPLSSRKSATK